MSKNIQCCFERYEKKYLLTREQYEAMLRGMAAQMRPDEYGSYSISNIYYDTEDDRLIRASLEKPVYKEKLRVRSYGTPGAGDRVFVELKKKFDGVVYKRREVMDAALAPAYLRGAAEGCGSQICHEIEYFMKSYRAVPKVFIAYDREAYAGRENSALRITFDTNLRWRDTALDLRAGDYGTPLMPEDTILMEIKIPGAAPLWLARLLSENRMFPTSFSKYGTYYKDVVLGMGPKDVSKKEVLSCA